MAKKKVEVASQSKEDKSLEKESKRLQELAFSRGLLSEERAVPAEPLRPHAGIIRCNGKDICKKGHRKNKYLFSFPGLVAPVAGGKFGDLTQLDSRNPVLYVDFLQGRLKLFGTIVYPKNKYITLNFVRGAGNIQCEDIFESLVLDRIDLILFNINELAEILDFHIVACLGASIAELATHTLLFPSCNKVVFSEAWWIGTKEENPDELRLDMPLDLQQEKHAVYDFRGGAGKPRNATDSVDVQPSQLEPVQASQLESSKLSTPKGQFKMDKWLFQKKCLEKKCSEKSSDSNAKAKHRSESESDEDDEGFVNLGDVSTPARQSARTAGKKHSYAESSSEENMTDDSGGDDDSDFEQRKPGGKSANKRFVRKDVEDSFLPPESQASKMDGADPLNGNRGTEMAITIDGNDDEEISIIDHLAASQTSAARSIASDIMLSTSIQAVANASTAGAVPKQSSLSSFFIKTSEKEKGLTAEPPVSVIELGSTRTYQRSKIKKSTVGKEDAGIEGESPISKADTDLVLPYTPPESHGSQRKRKAISEGKRTPKGGRGKGKSPVKRRKKTVEDNQSNELPILVSDDSDAD